MNTSYSSLNKRDKTAGSGQKQNFCVTTCPPIIYQQQLWTETCLVLPFFATTMTVDTHKTLAGFISLLTRQPQQWEKEKHSHCHNRRALSGRDLKALSVNNRLISSMIPQLQAALRELSPFDWLSHRSWATSSSQGGGRETQNPLTSASV